MGARARGQDVYLSLDYRHIRCSDLQWLDPRGAPLPLRPKEPPVETRDVAPFLPRGVVILRTQGGAAAFRAARRPPRKDGNP